MNGEIIDVGGVVAYINRKKTINWGVSLSHLPFRSFAGSEFQPFDTLPLNNDLFRLVDRQSIYEQRYFEERLGAFAQYPLSTTMRFEAGASYSLYSGRLDRRDYFYEIGTFFLIGQQREKSTVVAGL